MRIENLDGDQWPRDAGAYVLLIRLADDLTVRLPRGRAATLAPGLYGYCGSAYGPGGIAARVGRHFRGKKTIRWHVDQLTVAGSIEAVYSAPGGIECELLARLCRFPDTRLPIPGFGSTDCARCLSHLVQLPGHFNGTLLRSLGNAPK